MQCTLQRQKNGALILKADKEIGLLKYVDFHHSFFLKKKTRNLPSILAPPIFL